MYYNDLIINTLLLQHKSTFGPQYKFDAKFTVVFLGSSTQLQHLNPFQK